MNKVFDRDSIIPVEDWKPVTGYNGIYEVSDLGRVRSITRTMSSKYQKRFKGRLFHPSANSLYPKVMLS